MHDTFGRLNIARKMIDDDKEIVLDYYCITFKSQIKIIKYT